MQLSFGIVSALACLWITLVILACFIHFYKIEIIEERPWYLKWNIIRVVFAALYILCFNALSFAEWNVIAIFQVSSHMVIFNPGVNLLRSGKYQNDFGIQSRFPFWYLGQNSGWLDKLWINLGPEFYKCFYFVCVALMILSLVTLYSRYTY